MENLNSEDKTSAMFKRGYLSGAEDIYRMCSEELFNAVANCDGDINKINPGILSSDKFTEFFDKARKEIE